MFLSGESLDPSESEEVFLNLFDRDDLYLWDSRYYSDTVDLVKRFINKDGALRYKTDVFYYAPPIHSLAGVTLHTWDGYGSIPFTGVIYSNGAIFELQYKPNEYTLQLLLDYKDALLFGYPIDYYA